LNHSDDYERFFTWATAKGLAKQYLPVFRPVRWQGFAFGEDEVTYLGNGNLHTFFVMFANEMCFHAESGRGRSCERPLFRLISWQKRLAVPEHVRNLVR
jgi:hypothetical protein